MTDIRVFIESGILEMYILGKVSAEETKQVEEMAALHEEVRKELEQISEALIQYAAAGNNKPNSTVKPMIMAAIDYEERLKSGELQTFPPLLNSHSKISDYSQWTDRKDMVVPPQFDEIYVKLIGYTPEATTAIVWVSTETPYEVHTDQYERFLILEGTCNIDIDGKIHSLAAGNYLSIPLHAGHTVKVTSANPCKIILQRVAA